MKAWSVIGLLFAAAIFATVTASDAARCRAERQSGVGHSRALALS